MAKTQADGSKRSGGPTSIRLPSELSEFLKCKAGQRHTSVAGVILQLVQNWKDDEDQERWKGNAARFCDECRPRLVDLLYRKEAGSGRWQRRYNTPPLDGLDGE
ncbi:MAG TPA: hypothetical protein VGO93_18830 [Candidatus Xenobia bacterium]|jgi:hypothetical protein